MPAFGRLSTARSCDISDLVLLTFSTMSALSTPEMFSLMKRWSTTTSALAPALRNISLIAISCRGSVSAIVPSMSIRKPLTFLQFGLLALSVPTLGTLPPLSVRAKETDMLSLSLSLSLVLVVRVPPPAHSFFSTLFTRSGSYASPNGRLVTRPAPSPPFSVTHASNAQIGRRPISTNVCSICVTRRGTNEEGRD